MKYKGLIPNEQQEHVHLPLPSWQYGEIRDGRKIVDPILHYGCFVLGYRNDEIVDYVMDVVKSNKPEIAEIYMPKSNDVRLNHISFDFVDRINKISNMNCFFALSGSDANEGATAPRRSDLCLRPLTRRRIPARVSPRWSHVARRPDG